MEPESVLNGYYLSSAKANRETHSYDKHHMCSIVAVAGGYASMVSASELSA